jgi:predicted DNA-binding transcriptional regulator YafY
METLLRYLEMLRLIPVEPASISTQELLAKLQERNYPLDIRTLQRDLNKLSASSLFPFASTDNTRPLRWFWPKKRPRWQFPAMTPTEALSFKLVEQFLKPLLPYSVNQQLTDYFALAAATLSHSPFARWTDKIRFVSNNLSLIAPVIDSHVLTVVYDALLKNQRFTGIYQSCRRPDNETEAYEVNPLGLVFKDQTIYLTATLWDYHDIRQLALHRFKAATLLEKPAEIPPGFSLDHYNNAGEFEYPLVSGRSLPIVLKIKPWLKKQLTETPLASNQHITPLNEGSYRLNATVHDTRQLRWWLKSLGADVEILMPEPLRQEFADTAQALHQLYGSMPMPVE